MKVTICKDGITAKDELGNVLEINQLVIKKDRGMNVFFSPNEKFFKVACPSKTVHTAIVLESGKINIV